jgi:hypothetical protein
LNKKQAVLAGEAALTQDKPEKRSGVDREDQDYGLAHSGEGAETPSPASPLVLNHSLYLPMIDDLDCSEAQKIEFLEALWSIMTSFVALGFGVDSVQLLFPDIFENPSNAPGDMVSSRDTQPTKDNGIPAIEPAEKGDQE